MELLKLLTDLGTIKSLLTGLIAAVVTALFTWNVAMKNLKLKYITEERQKWRMKMKTDITAFCHSNDWKRAEILTEVRLNLNPVDIYDIAIINQMRGIIESPFDQKAELIVELERLVQCLLKHDWQRAKKEASTFSWLKLGTTRGEIVNESQIMNEENG